MTDEQLKNAVQANKLLIEATELLDDCLRSLTALSGNKENCIGLHISSHFIKNSSTAGELLSLLAKAFKMEIAIQKEQIKNL